MITSANISNGDLVKRYVEIRDYIKARTDDFGAEMKQWKEGLTAIEGMLNLKLQTENEQNIKTEFGTAFFQSGMSVKVANKPVFFNAIIMQVADAALRQDMAAAQKAMTILTANVSKDEIKEYMAANEDRLPPGVEVEHFKTVQVRRA